jgi:hypothetical protein
VNAFHSGDLGDIIYALPAMRAAGAPVHLFVNTRPWTAPMSAKKLGVIKSLLEAQPFVASVVLGECPTKTKLGFSTFRNGGLPFGVTLADLQARWVGMSIDKNPWLTAKPDSVFAGKVLCHRSPRYHNPYFNWRAVGEEFGNRMVFLGLDEEVAALRKSTGVNAPHAKFADYAALASALAAAELFIGNQSSPMAVAIGLGVPFIQETCLWVPDCIYPRRNGFYCVDGGIPKLRVPAFDPPPDVDRGIQPPGGWQCVMPDSKERRVFRSHRAAAKAMFDTGCFASLSSAEQEVDRQLVERIPALVRRDSEAQLFGHVRPLVDAVNNLATL